MKKRLLLLTTSTVILLQLSAQSVNTNFAWTTTSSASTSISPNFPGCLPSTRCTLQTGLPHQLNNNGNNGPISNGHPITSPLIPHPTTVMPLTFNVRLTFSWPVHNVRLLVRDLDDDQPNNMGPEETLSAFLVNGISSAPTSIMAVQGSYNSSLSTIIPTAANTNGWINFNMNNISSIEFTYTRYTTNYALLLDSLIFDCGKQIGMDEYGTLGGISAFPNPAADVLTLENKETDNLTWELTDLSGKTVRSGALIKGQPPVDVSEIAAGIYLLQCSGAEGTWRKKVLITR